MVTCGSPMAARRPSWNRGTPARSYSICSGTSAWTSSVSRRRTTRLLQEERPGGGHLLQPGSLRRRQGGRAPLLQLSELRGRTAGHGTVQRGGGRQAPLSERGKEQLLRVLNGGLHAIDVPEGELEDYIGAHSYFDYLKDTLGVDDPGVLRMARHSGPGLGRDGNRSDDHRNGQGMRSIGLCSCRGLRRGQSIHPSFSRRQRRRRAGAGEEAGSRGGRGNNAEELVLSRFDYAELDKPRNAVRIRLNSTVIDVRHEGDPRKLERGPGQVHQRRQGLSGPGQRRGDGLLQHDHSAHRLGSSGGAGGGTEAANEEPVAVHLRRLEELAGDREIGMGLAMSPGNMHQAVLMDFPVSLGGYEYTKTPDDPCVLQMISCPYGRPSARRDASSSARRATGCSDCNSRLRRGDQGSPGRHAAQGNVRLRS